jgi:hypothetical protein
MSATFKLGLLSLLSSLESSSLEDKLNVLITFAQKGLSSSFIEVVDGIPYRFELTPNLSQPEGTYQVRLSPLQNKEAETICQIWKNTKATEIGTHTWAGFCNDICVPNWVLLNSRLNEEKIELAEANHPNVSVTTLNSAQRFFTSTDPDEFVVNIIDVAVSYNFICCIRG